MNENNFIPKVIPDEVIDLRKIDLLDTRCYVETLKNIIMNCRIPFTIGLFGSWGSGKSSIIKTLKEEFDNQEKVKVFIYNAWKYSKDDFRRSFILEIRKYFELDTKEEEELFYKEKVEDIKYKPKFDLWSLIILISVFFLSLIFFALILKENMIRHIIASTSFSALITVIFSFFRNILVYHKISLTTSKLFSPEQFEKRFENTIKDVKKNKKIDKIVIAIDEIDRCSKEQVLEIIQTVKTFLEKEGVIFLLSLDDNELKEYLNLKREDANEFLRKIFNTYIRIKKFSENELYDFTLDLINKYQINLPKKEIVASLITQEFSKNPRRIIQFLNTLQNEFFLAKLQEEKGLIEKGAISQNIEMLIKILILKEEYLDFYEKIYDTTFLLNDVTQAIRENKILKNEKGEYEYKANETGLKIILDENLYRFLKRTSNIELEPLKLKPFFIIKDVFKDLPPNCYNYIISQDWEKIKDMIDKNEIEFKKVLEFIDSIVNEEVIKRKLYKTSGFNLASLVFKIIKDKSSEIEELPKNILAFLNIEEIWEQIYNFPIEELAYSAKWFHKVKMVPKVVENILNKINKTSTEDFLKNIRAIDLLNKLIVEFKDTSEILSKIRDKFSELLIKDFNLIFKFDDSVVKNCEVLKELLNNEFAEKILPTLHEDFITDLTIKHKVEIIKCLKIKKILKTETKKKYIEKYIEFIKTSFSPQLYGRPNLKWNLYSFWLNAIYDFIDDSTELEVLNEIFSILSNSFSFIYQAYENKRFEDENIKTYKFLINICKKIYFFVDENKQQQIINWFDKFLLPNINNEIFNYIIDAYKEIIEKIDDWKFADSIIEKFNQISDKDLKEKLVEALNLMLNKTSNKKGLNREQIKKIISSYFNYLFMDDEKAEKWFLEILQNSFITEEITNQIIYFDSDKFNKASNIIKKIISNYGFEKIYPQIKDFLGSKEKREQITAIDFLYNLKESGIEIKIDKNQKDLLLGLLEDIKFSDDEKEIEKKRNEVYEWLSQQIEYTQDI